MFPIYINDENMTELPSDNFCYIIAKDGIYLKKSTGLIESVVKVDRISFLKDLKSHADIDIPKLPTKLVGNILGFFRDIYDEYKSEAVVLLYFNEKTGEFKVHAPMQVVSGGAADYKPENIEGPAGFLLYGTIHSHANMGAFHSGTDIRDEENFDGLHITFGRMATEKFDIEASIAVNGHRVSVDPRDYLEGIDKKSASNTPGTGDIPGRSVPVKDASGVVKYYGGVRQVTWEGTWELIDKTGEVTYPTEWFERVSKPVFRGHNRGPYTGGTANANPFVVKRKSKHQLPATSTSGHHTSPNLDYLSHLPEQLRKELMDENLEIELENGSLEAGDYLEDSETQWDKCLDEIEVPCYDCAYKMMYEDAFEDDDDEDNDDYDEPEDLELIYDDEAGGYFSTDPEDYTPDGEK